MDPKDQPTNPEPNPSGNADPGAGAGDPAPTEQIAVPAEPAPEPAPEAPKPQSKVLTIPTSAMGDIKRKERDRGRTEARSEYDTAAKEMGYESHEDMMTALRAQKVAGTRTPAQTPAPAADASDFDADPVDASPKTDKDARSRVVSRLEREKGQLLEDRKKLNRARAHEERQRKALQGKLDAQEAEHELRFAAVRAGVDDVDYAVVLLRRQLIGKTEEELAQFDEGAFFNQELKKSHPYLYKSGTREANSSPAPDGVAGKDDGAPTPAAPTAQPDGAQDSQVDARKLSNDAYAQLLRKRGLTHPAVGMPT